MEKYEKIQQVLFSGDSTRVGEWMRGKYTSEQIHQYLEEETNINYTTLWETFVHDCRHMQVSDEVLSLISDLRKTFHVVLITGNMDCFDRFTAPTLKLDKYFDSIVNSYNEGILKSENDGETFKKYVRGDIVDSILIEDSKKSCNTFEKLGGTAYRVTNKEEVAEYLKQISLIN